MSQETVASDAQLTADGKMKITDLIPLALDTIFVHLNLGDLLSLSDTSKVFKPSAARAFQSKYGKNRMIFRGNHGTRCNHPIWQADNICVDDFTMCLKILRCFGHAIVKLNINYSGMGTRKCAQIDDYLIDYCTSLTDITFKHAKNLTLSQMVKPFDTVENLTFEDSMLSGKLANFNRWFPKMASLELRYYIEFGNGKVLEKHFPNLQNLTINGQLENVDWSNIIATLQANPHLRRLTICDYYGMKFLRNASKSLHFLEHLTLLKWAESQFDHDGDFIHFKHVQHLTVDFSRLCDVQQMALHFDQIETLTIDSVYMCRFNHNFIDFIRKHTKLRKLKIIWQNYGFQRRVRNSCNAVFKENLAQASSYLWDIDFGALLFTLNEAVSFLAECKSLKKFCLTLSDETEYDDLHEHLGNEWTKLTDNQNCIRFERTTPAQNLQKKEKN